MKLILSFLIVVFLSLNCKSQSIAPKIGNDEIEQINAWHYLLGLNDQSSILLWADKHRTKLSMKKFDKDGKMILEKVFWELITENKGKVEISGIYEIDNSIVLLMSFSDEGNIKFFKLLINPNTGKKMGEIEVSKYSGLKPEFIKNENYFFDFTKDDSLKIYTMVTFVRITDNVNELKIIAFSYDHKQINSYNKNIEVSSPLLSKSFSFLSSIQQGKYYYFAMSNYQVNDSEIKKTKPTFRI